MYENYETKVRNNVFHFISCWNISKGILDEKGFDIWIEDNVMLEFTTLNSVGIELRDTTAAWVVDNLMKTIGSPWEMYYSGTWGILYTFSGDIGNPLQFITIMDNQIYQAFNGIKLDFSFNEAPDPTTGLYSDKVIEGNLVYASIFPDYPAQYGNGIEIIDAQNLQVSNNTVKYFDTGGLFNYNPGITPTLDLLRNEFLSNSTSNVTINMPTGTIRSYYNFIGDITLPANYLRPPFTIDRYNLDINGNTP